jgi:peroxiredoxin
MKSRILSFTAGGALVIAAAMHSLTAGATLKPGDAAPDFTAQASLGGNVYDYSLADALRKGPVVLYFYPAAFTKGCTIEAHEFAEAVDQYKAEGATVIGVSHDNIAADADSKIIRSYDASMPMKSTMANRVSYVIAPDGKVIYEYTSLSPDQHVANTLQALRDWNAKHKTQ